MAIVTPTLVVLLLAIGIASFPNRSLSRTERAEVAQVSTTAVTRDSVVPLTSPSTTVALAPGEVPTHVEGVAVERTDTVAVQLLQLRLLIADLLQRVATLERHAR